MSNVQKLMIAVAGVFAVGFLMIGTSGKTEQDLANDAALQSSALLFKVANRECPKAIKEQTGVAVFSPTESESDKKTYVKNTWVKKDGPFKKATCLIVENQGSIKELTIDGKSVLKDGLPVTSG